MLSDVYTETPSAGEAPVYNDSNGRFELSKVALDPHTHSYQPLDADLTAIAALSGTSGLLKKTAANTWALDTSAYLTSITKAQVEAVLTGAITSHTHSYQPLDADLTAIAALSGTSGLLKKTAANTWSLDTSTYLTAITKAQVEAVLTGAITSHTHAYEASLGNPPATNYVLTSTTAGVRNWVSISTIISWYAATDNSSPYNTWLGYVLDSDEGTYNTTMGYLTDSSTGTYNVTIGANAGHMEGDYNVIIGGNSGTVHGTTRLRNVIIGYNATNGWSNTIGGTLQSFNDKLVIANSNTATPLIYGDFSTPSLTINGSLTVTGLISTATTALTFDYTNKYTTAFSTCVMNGRREGKTNTLSGYLLITTNGSTTARLLANISNYVSPGYTVYFPLNVRQTYEGAVGYIDTSGNIYILWGQNSSEYFYFTATWITK